MNDLNKEPMPPGCVFRMVAAVPALLVTALLLEPWSGILLHLRGVIPDPYLFFIELFSFFVIMCALWYVSLKLVNLIFGTRVRLFGW